MRRSSPERNPRRSKRGYVLLALALSAVTVFGMVGLSLDLGRLYIAKQEAQAFADAAAVAATLELDGTTAGLDRARAAARADINRWNFGNTSFATPVIEFGTAATGAFSQNPGAAGILFTRVTAQAPQKNFFVQLFNGPATSAAQALAVAGQVPKTRFLEGVFPFSPMIHDAADPDFGYSRGEEYTIRWAAAPKDNKPNTCKGDRQNQWINQAEAGGGSDRGYIEETSASIIKQAIEGDYQSHPWQIGDYAPMTGGSKQTALDSIVRRINQDTDTSSTTYSAYSGNGRRLVAVPVNTWSPDFRIVGFASFLLQREGDYKVGGNFSWCAVYVGPWVQGSNNQGAGQAGAYVVRLVQ